MARMETQLDNLSDKVGETDKAVVRVHERVDQALADIAEVKAMLASRDAGIASIVDAAVNAHAEDERRVIDLRFGNLDQKLDAHALHFATIEQSGTARLEAMQDGFKELKIIAVKVSLGILAGGAAIAGYIITWLWNHSATVDLLNAAKPLVSQ
jgi:hypothetical protein